MTTLGRGHATIRLVRALRRERARRLALAPKDEEERGPAFYGISTASGRVVFVLPGSRGAVALAMDKLLLPELAHLAGEAVKTR